MPVNHWRGNTKLGMAAIAHMPICHVAVAHMGMAITQVPISIAHVGMPIAITHGWQ